MAEYIKCRNCESPDCKGCNLKRLETMLENGKFDCMMNENRCINTSADVEPVQEWIPVKDKLPEIVSTHKRYRSTIKKSIRVLCVCVQKSGKTMVKEGYCEWYNDYPEPRWQIPGTIDDVTHWMPLPEPPKGE